MELESGLYLVEHAIHGLHEGDGDESDDETDAEE